MRTIDVKYYTSIFEKRYSNNTTNLQRKITMTIRHLLHEYMSYFQQFDRIVVYYDGGQGKLSHAIEEAFKDINGYERKKRFDHQEKKLFQVADTLTVLDKIFFKYDNNIKMTNTESRFFSIKMIKNAKRTLDKKRFDRVSKIRKAPFRVL